MICRFMTCRLLAPHFRTGQPHQTQEPRQQQSVAHHPGASQPCGAQGQGTQLRWKAWSGVRSEQPDPVGSAGERSWTRRPKFPKARTPQKFGACLQCPLDQMPLLL